MVNCAPIGVFDSGLGGLSVLKEMMTLMPHENFIYYGDSARAPYGTKSVETVRHYSDEIVDYFVQQGVKAVVIACNTATSAAADYLRQKHTIPIIGVEPALKPAALENRGGHILVLATEMTLRENKFSRLMQQYQNESTISKVAVPEFVTLVDQGKIEAKAVESILDHYLEAIPKEAVSAVVLGCTHYVFLKVFIEAYFKHPVKLYDGNFGTANHLQQLLVSREACCTKGLGEIRLENSLGEVMVERSYQLLNYKEGNNG